MTTNSMMEVWARGDVAFGAWCTAGSPVIAEMFALSGYSYVCIDEQHGVGSYDVLLSSLIAVSRTTATPVVRVPTLDNGVIGRALDAGAAGVIIPMVSTPQQAEEAVAACRYFPKGIRSFSSTRGSLVLGGHPSVINEQVSCIVMIETEEGVNNVDLICSVEGVNAIYVGPADLAINLGYAPSADIQPGRHADAIDSIVRACRASGVVAGIHCATGAQARARASQGFQMITVGTDWSLLRTAAKSELENASASEA